MSDDRFPLLSLLAALILFGSAVFLLFMINRMDLLAEVSSSLVISFLMIFVSYLISRRAFGKSTTQFYRLVFGGMAGRFVFFLAALFIIKFSGWSLAGFVISFAIFYAVFQILEIMLITKQFRKKNRA